MPTEDPYARYFEPMGQPKKRPRLDRATNGELLAKVLNVGRFSDPRSTSEAYLITRDLVILHVTKKN